MDRPRDGAGDDDFAAQRHRVPSGYLGDEIASSLRSSQ
jgi:hypothetical protein